MCRQCAWEKIKLKCKICGEIIANGYPRLLAHITAHYATSELLHNEEVEENIILINFDGSKISTEAFGENGDDYALRCRICGDHFTFKKKR